MDQWTQKFMHLTATAIICLGGLAYELFSISADSSKSNLPLLLFLCGASGAVIANYQRLAALSLDKGRIDDRLRGSMVSIQLYISPAVGGTFALVLWAAFFSGLIKGDFFPLIDGTDQAYNNFHDLMTNTRPHQFKDAMKGVFWSFLAGYSEKYVPNILDRLAQKGE